MPGARPAAAAGRFYAADAGRLRDQVDRLLAAAKTPPVGARVGDGRIGGVDSLSPAPAPARPAPPPPPPRAIIAPHAGYPFSGPVAAIAFAAAAAVGIDRIVIVGPSHYLRFEGIALPRAGAYRTPLGDMPVAAAAVDELSALPYVVCDDAPHRHEHSIEVELPFLQRLFGEVPIVPLVTGAATPPQVAEALAALWDDRTLLVVSSDLSHFLAYDAARQRDAATAAIIVAGDPADLNDADACGRLAIQGLKTVAAERGYNIELLDLRNSGDTAGGRHEVVGYGAFRVDAPPPVPFPAGR